jgi:hypothetical protein
MNCCAAVDTAAGIGTVTRCPCATGKDMQNSVPATAAVIILVINLVVMLVSPDIRNSNGAELLEVRHS